MTFKPDRYEHPQAPHVSLMTRHAGYLMQALRHNEERREQDVVQPVAELADTSTNLLTSGEMDGKEVRLPQGVNRVRLSASMSDPDAVYQLQRYDGSAWQDLAILAPGEERRVTAHGGDRLRLRVRAATAATMTNYRLALRQIQEG